MKNPPKHFLRIVHISFLIFVLWSFVNPNRAETCSGALGSGAPQDDRSSSKLLDELRRINRQLEARTEPWKIRELTELGVVKISPEKVYDLANPDQLRPVQIVRLPFAHTGFYLPKWQRDSQHVALMIFLPGMGATVSQAKALLNVVSSFHGHRSRNRGHRHGGKTSDWFEGLNPADQNFRIAAIAADTTLNGLQEGAPEIFATEEGSIEVMRHIHLVARVFFENLPVYFAGRSQGGLTAMSYATRYHDLAGVIAVNPSVPDPEVIKASLRVVEEKGSKGIFAGKKGVELHPRSWQAYSQYTGDFTGLRHDSKVPAMVILGKDDISYHDGDTARGRYLMNLDLWRSHQPSLRSVVEIDGAHDLWNRQEERVYRHVLRIMAQFVLANNLRIP